MNDNAIEKKAKMSGKSLPDRMRLWLKLKGEIILGQVLLSLSAKFKGIDWGDYKKEVVSNTDFWKFDDTLRFVFDVSQTQKQAIISSLEAKKNESKIFFGTQSSSSALMTCLIFDRQGNHVHFIDGADGGYALAATKLKESMRG